MREESDVQSDLISSSDSQNNAPCIDDDDSRAVTTSEHNEAAAGNVDSSGEETEHFHRADVQYLDVPCDADETPGSSFMTYSGRKHKVYTDEFKKRAVRVSKGSSFKAAAGRLKIDPKTVASWKKSIESKKNHEEPTNPEEAVLLWLTEMARSGQKVELKAVVDKLESLGDWRRVIKSGWFVEWTAKLVPAGEGPSFPLDSRVQFPYKFKAVVAQLARNQSHASLSKALCVSRKQIYNWLKEYDSLVVESTRNGEKTGQRCGAEAVKQGLAEQKLFAWFMKEKVCTGECPKYAAVKRKARALFCASGFPRLQCSYGWFTRWKARFSIEDLKHPLDEPLVAWVLARYDSNSAVTLASFLKNAVAVAKAHEGDAGRRRNCDGPLTKDWAINFAKRNSKYLQLPGFGGTDSKLPLQLEESAERFLGEVRRMKGLYGLENIGNMDEVFLTLGDEDSKSFIPCGPVANTLGTVVLSCLATGRVLPPLLILNGGKGCEYPTSVQEIGTLGDCQVLFSKDGKVHPEVLRLWLRTIWVRNVRAPSLLLLDSFACHEQEEWRDWCNDEGVTVMSFPSGTACHRQPVDLTVKKCFSEEFRRNLLSLQPPRRTEHSKIETISRAVFRAWTVIRDGKEDLVRLAFEKLFEDS